MGNSQGIYVKGGGKNVTITSSQSVGDLIIENANDIDISGESFSGNFTATTNGNAILRDLDSFKGNINLSSVGSINLVSAKHASGTLILNNERATFGTDITIGNAASVGTVKINSAGQINAISNDGLKSAKNISATFAEDSKIIADGVSEQTIALYSENEQNTAIVMELDASTVESLSLGGSSPLIVKIDASDLSTETVTSANSNASLQLYGVGSDLSNISNSINMWLDNFDGETLIVNSNQKFYFDAEIAQTAQVSPPVFNFIKDATSSTNNTISISTRDSNSGNSDSTSNIAGLHFTEIQSVTFDLSSGIDLLSTGNLSGTDLTKVVLTGSGSFSLGGNTILGAEKQIELDGSAAKGAVSVDIKSASNGVSFIKTGEGNDSIKIDGLPAMNGIIIQSGGGDDLIQITTNADGSSSKINIDAGQGKDTISLDPNVDLSQSDFTLTSIEKLIVSASGTGSKIKSAAISGKSTEIVKSGSESYF